LFNCNRQSDEGNTNKQKDTISDFLKEIQLSKKLDRVKTQEYKNALSVLVTQDNSRTNRENLLIVTAGFNEFDEFDLLRRSNNLLLNRAIEKRDTSKIAQAYYYAGNYYLYNQVRDSAFYFYLRAEKLLLKSRQLDVLGDLYLNKSTIQLSYIDFLGAEQSATQSLKFARINNNKLAQYDALNNLGIASHSSENFKKSIEYHFQALNLAKENNLNPEYFLQEISLNNIGNCFLYLKDYKNASKQFELALQNSNLPKQKPSLYATLLDNLSYAKFKLKDNKVTLAYFLKSLKIRDSLKLDSRIVYSKIHISEYYSFLNDTINSQKYAKEALELSKLTKLSSDLLGSLKQLSIVDHKNSSSYSKDYIRISDSIQLEERKSKDKFARIAFETDEIIQEKDKLAEQNRNLLYFFLATLFVGLLLFVIRTQRAKNRELLLKQQQQKVNEEIYNLMITQQATIEENRVKEKKRIAQELHDGVLGRLFGARLNLDSLNRFSDDESVTSRFNYLAELKNIEQDIREISHDLNREKYVLINNFVAIVSNLLEEQSNSFEADLTSNLDESIQWDKVSNAVKINLYRILQESLQNINKYANAQHILVEFRKENDQIMFKITDDGIGFDVNTKKKGIGLQNMQSRVQECDGTFEIKSKKGKGTTTVVLVPIEKKLEEV
jgi:signal transduction histidine kinase